ncbi:hypothetical protein NMQ14_08070 [Methyloversatilis sp. XJ19-13]|uniref:hypothetical protein n=1 Tax=Methyloversatilis sp. XJ19-13 TaxID=2963430 RepID=UPI00211C2BEB|nr:hypothetical protein [Methyloversatilis sp. XJ19-13]MCQ9374201.1 hypothetical protein [Methyloversatilis sp. XJ19-13]
MNSDLWAKLQQIDIARFWDATTNQPTWYWSMILGALSGLVLTIAWSHAPKLLLFPVFLYKFFFKKSALVGDWNAYHWTYVRSKPGIVKSFVQIRRGLLHPYVVQLKENIDSQLHYKGRVQIEKDQILVYFDSTDHQESLVVRLRNPLGKVSNELCAIWLGYDHDGDITAGALLLTKSDLSEDAAKRAISKCIENPSTAALMCLRRT